MKKKIISIFLSCFIFLYSSITCFANPLISLAPQIIATIGTIAVASGIVLEVNDDLYDIARVVYDRIDKTNEGIEAIFLSSVALGVNGVLNVGSDFLNLVKNALDDMYIATELPGDISGHFLGYGVTGLSFYDINMAIKGGVYNTSFYSSLPQFHKIVVNSSMLNQRQYLTDRIYVELVYYTSSSYNARFYVDGESFHSIPIQNDCGEAIIYECKGLSNELNKLALIEGYSSNFKGHYAHVDYMSTKAHTLLGKNSVVSLPTQPDYSWENIGSNVNDNGSLDIYLPGNAGSLIGNPGNTLANAGNPGYSTSTDGVISMPIVSNPSISIGNDITIPKDEVADTPVDPPVDTPVDPPVDTPIIPSFPSFGDSIDFSPLEVSGIKEKFPFSLPWDIGRLLDSFSADPIAPKFEFPIKGEKLIIDLTIFDEWANISRFFVSMCFILSLIFITTKLKS